MTAIHNQSAHANLSRLPFVVVRWTRVGVFAALMVFWAIAALSLAHRL